MFAFPPWPVSGFPAGRKSNWAMLQPVASVRPVITKRSCTSPSALPLVFLNRASRTGPFCVMNHGTVFFAPFKVAIAIKGFCAELVPPAAGCEWQDKHWLELNRGRKAIIRAAGHDLNFSEPRQPILEECNFVRGKTLERGTATCRATAHAWVYWS